MTKKEANKRAKLVLSKGCFQPGKGKDPIPGTGSLVYAYCPLCKQKVEYDGMAWDSIAKLRQGLTQALTDHIAEEH